MKVAIQLTPSVKQGMAQVIVRGTAKHGGQDVSAAAPPVMVPIRKK